MSDPFHAGEQAIQEITGERDVGRQNGSIIGDAVPPPAAPFVAQQTMAVLSREDGEGRLWPALIFGPKGFASVTPDRRGLVLETGDAGATAKGAPLADLDVGDRLGGLFIELTTRRRLRVNGTIEGRAAEKLTLAIAEAYPACPKYIQRRAMETDPAPGGAPALETGEGLPGDVADWLAAADTLFVASGPKGGPLDVSHRGGAPGFVRVVDGRLRVPDYPGNSMFNTLGNFHADPRAGIVIPDFATGRQLSMTGTATLHVEGPASGDPNGPTGGTDRWWDFAPEAWTVLTPAVPRSWGAAEASPFNPAAGEVA